MCVVQPKEAGTAGHRFGFLKTELNLQTSFFSLVNSVKYPNDCHGFNCSELYSIIGLFLVYLFIDIKAMILG